MLRVHRARHVQALRNEEEADLGELERIHRLELRLQALEAHERLVAMTRRVCE